MAWPFLQAPRLRAATAAWPKVFARLAKKVEMLL